MSDIWGMLDGDDGGVYYSRDIDDRVYWFGERRGETDKGHPIAIFANVFRGRRSGDDIEGEWWDVPKGNTQGSGSLDLRLALTTGGSGFPSLRKTRATGGFGGTVWETGAGQPVLDATGLPAGFSARTEEDLTGTWVSSSDATYYIRQIGNRVVWYGERGDPGGGVDFSNVLIAERDGNRISGEWVDVPKGRATGQGRLDLQVINGWSLQRVSESGGFGDEWLHRVDAFWVDLEVDRFFMRENEDAFGDEPLVWFAFYKQDGDTVDWSRHAGEPRMSFDIRPEAFNRVLINEPAPVEGSGFIFRGGGGFDFDFGNEGTYVVPPELGKFTTVLRTTRGFDPGSPWARLPTHLGVIAIAWDADHSGTSSTRAAFDQFGRRVQENLNERSRRWFSWISPLAEAGPTLAETVTTAGREADRELLDRDSWATDSHDFINTDHALLQFADFRDAQEVPVSMRFEGDGASYGLTGRAVPEFRDLDPATL